MKNYLSLFVIITGLLVACQTETKNEIESNKLDSNSKQTDIQSSGVENAPISEEIVENLNWIVYEGFIGLYQQHVIVTLSISEGNLVTGSYFYDKHQKHLDLNGTYDPKSGKYELTESYKNKKTGILIFQNFNGVLKGNWLKSVKDKDVQELELRILYTAGNEKPQVVFSTYKMKHEISIYNGEGEDLMDVTDVLKVAKINTDYYSFSYSLTRRNGHTGGADGIIRMDKNTKKQIGHFYGESECDLEFEFTGKNVDIVEHDCEYYHGANAYMDGQLTLAK